MTTVLLIVAGVAGTILYVGALFALWIGIFFPDK
jgi:hypothetical protein